MVYLSKMVIFHGYVSHNQMVIFGCLPFFWGTLEDQREKSPVRSGWWFEPL